MSRKRSALVERLVDALLDARLGYGGRDAAEQRRNTRIWAQVLLERGLPSVGLRIAQAKARPPLDEKAELIRDIRRHLPYLAMGYPELAEQISRAMDLVEADAPPVREPGS